MYARARDRLFSRVRLGINEECCIAAFSDQNQSTTYGLIAVIRALIRTKWRFNSDILHTNPYLVGRSHPVSVEVREFDWE